MLQYLINGVVIGCVYALFGLGLSVAWGVLKLVNVAHAQLFTFGALMAVFLGGSTDLSLGVILVVAMVGTGVAALALDTVAFWPLRRKGLSVEEMEINSLITAFGAALIFTAVFDKATGGDVVSLSQHLFTVKRYEIGSAGITNIQIIVALSAVALTVLVWLIVARTQVGRALRALAHSRPMTEAVGVDTARLYRITLFGCGVLAGAAGVLLAVQRAGIDSRFGDPLLLVGIAIIVIVGSGEILGTLVGGLVLGITDALAFLWLPTYLGDLIPFVLIAVVLMIRPSGLFGRAVATRV